MFSSRFSSPEPVNDSRLLKNSCRLKLDFYSHLPDDGDPPGTVYVGYTLEGDMKLKPDESAGDVLGLIAAFRAAQAEKGGSHEANS